MQIKNPATGAVIEEVAEDSALDVARKLERARRAQPAWASTPLSERVAIIDRFRESVARERDQLALILTREVGKPISQATNELNALTGRLEFFAGASAGVLEGELVLQEADAGRIRLQELISHEPLGVIANISAWNYPWFVGSNVFVPALLTGNAVLYKPSEHATLTGLAIARLLHGAGVPEDVFITLVGGPSTGASLLEQPVDGVFFTGSHGTGRKIALAAAPRFIRVGLELGGKDPTYVCDDVDLRAAAESLADGAMYNSGQSCCSVERIYVHRKVHDEFVELFAQTVQGFALGDPEEPATYIGPLARSEQLQVLELQVDDALRKGARLLCGGHRVSRPGNYFEPTVLAGARQDMLVMREESFGPIIGIAAVEDDAQAVSAMNDTDYGLTAGVYTRDRQRAERILKQVNAGSVYWNCCDRVSPRLPWTGRKSSGMGSTLSHYGIRAFLQPKAWHLRTM
ncbi:MAG TPA: aldehyde dehydrogenase family protein [Polyangiaceae bacterium]|nr:aldehyde dehydrogenase family protein [Polyangiaceae bacterium]